MCQGGIVSVIVTFSALATDVLNATGDARAAALGHTDFLSHAFPFGADQDPFTPEGAAGRAFEATATRVTAVPDLIMAPMPASQMLIHWRILLEKPVAVRAGQDGASRQRQSLFGGFQRIFLTSGLLDAAANAPVAEVWTDPVTK
jgi:hypothetical protein